MDENANKELFLQIVDLTIPMEGPNKADGKRRGNRVKRNNSFNKFEKQAINARTRVMNMNKKSIDGAALKQMKTLENQVISI